MKISINVYKILLGAVVSIFAAACGNDTADLHLASAKTFLEKKDEKSAIIELKNALQKAPDTAEARFLLGRALLDSGDPAGAVVHLRKAYDLKLNSSTVVPTLVSAMIAAGQSTAAGDEFATTLLTDRIAMSELQARLAYANKARGQIALAERNVADALRLNSHNVTAQMYQAASFASRKDPDAALRTIDRVLSTSPNDVDALVFKADVLRLGKFEPDSALLLYRRALVLRSSTPAAHAGIIIIMLMKEQTTAAALQLAELKKLWPNSLQSRWFEGQIALRRHDYKEAARIAAQLLAANPSNAEFLFFSAAVSIESGSIQQAENPLAKALQVAPENADIRRQLARVYLDLGQPEKAFGEIRPLIDDKLPDTEALRIAGQSQLFMGDFHKARQYFSRTSGINSSDQTGHVEISTGNFSREENGTRISDLRKISDSDSGMIADLLLIKALAEKTDYEGAFKAVGALEKKTPNSPLPLHLRGLIFAAMHDKTNARINFERALSIDAKYFKSIQALSALDMADNQPQVARARLESYLLFDPKNIEAMLALARLRTIGGASEAEVTNILDRAVKLDPNAVGPRVMLIENLLSVNDVKRALEAAQTGNLLIADNPAIVEILARAQALSGDRSQAIVSYQRLASIQPQSVIPLLRLAEIYMVAGENDSARRNLKQAVSLDPGAVSVRRGLIAVALAEGRNGVAIEEARAYQRLRPGEETGYLLEANVFLALKEYSSAVTAFRKAYDKEKSPIAAIELHAALRRLDHKSEADAFVAERLREYPSDVNFIFAVGEYAVIQKDFAGAQRLFANVVKLAPDSAVAYNNLAWLMVEQREKGAVAYAEKANLLQKDNLSFKDTLAGALAAEGQIDKAVDLQKSVVDANAQNPGFRLHLARMYIQAGKKSLARDELKRLAANAGRYEDRDEVARLLKTL